MISVLLPTYNSANYLYYSIKSILDQSFKNFELLIIDDGSTDNTSQIVNSFNDKRIKYFQRAHIGISSALNFGLEIASFNWIARMDADDISLKSRLEKQYSAAEHEGADIISSWYAIFDKSIKYVIKVPESHEEIKKKLLVFSSICHPSVFYRKDKIIELGGYQNLKYAQDYDLWLRAKDSVKFYNIQEILLFYRSHNSSKSNLLSNKIRESTYKIQSFYYKNLEKEFNIMDKREISLYKGLREFFWGDAVKARGYWSKLGLNIFFNPKILFAYILTFLKKDSLIKFIDSKIWLYFDLQKYRIKFIFNKHIKGKHI